MSALDNFEMTDLKRIYRALHAALSRDVELLDSEFLSTLQTHLQQAATADGVDVSNHGEWDRWLREAPSPSSLSLVKGS